MSSKKWYRAYMWNFNRWTLEYRPPNYPQKKYRYGEYPTQVDPENGWWVDRYYVYPKLQRKAVYQMNKAIKKGFLVRGICQLCHVDDGSTPHGHHESYALWLHVVWLCKSCHDELHWTKRYDRDHTSQREPILSIVIMESEKNLTLGWPVSIIPEFCHDIPSENPASALRQEW